jgi:hypothetical protein
MCGNTLQALPYSVWPALHCSAIGNMHFLNAPGSLQGGAAVPAAAEQLAHQPVHVWIGGAHAAAESSLLLAGDAAAAADGLQDQLGGSAAGSHRSSKQHKQRAAPQPALASLVAA